MECRCNRGGGDLRPSAEARQQLAIELLGGVVVVPMAIKAYTAGDHPLGAEARIDVERTLKGSKEETCRRKENDRRRNLRDDERTAQPDRRSPVCAPLALSALARSTAVA